MSSLSRLSCRDRLVAPSILAADFAQLANQVRETEANGAQLVHIDIMDAHLVPNLSFGPWVVQCLRPHSKLCFDTHLMITNPSRYIAPFVKAGSNHITFHVESEDSIPDVIDQIHALDCTAGLSLRPGTPAETILPYLDKIEMILVMTVEPGFGGQSFREDQLPKIRQFREAIEQSGREIHLEVDGGITAATARPCVAAGANILVAGSSIFGAKDGIAAAIQTIADA